MAFASKLVVGQDPVNLARRPRFSGISGPRCATRRFDHINIDIVGPLPSSQGYTHLLAIVHRFTRWPEAIPLKVTDTETCARALIFHWIARFGKPLDMTSDRGSQFMSNLWTTIAKVMGTKLHPTTAYHPQANGLVERFHRHLKSALRARLTNPNWLDELPWVLLGIRTVPKEDLNCSSAELVYGTPLTVPGDFVATPQGMYDSGAILPHLRDTISKFTPTPTAHQGGHIRPLFLLTCWAVTTFLSVVMPIARLFSVHMKALFTSWKGIQSSS